jgi:hypothetical protein
MKKALFLLLAFLIACAPVQEAPSEMQDTDIKDTEVRTIEKVDSAPEPVRMREKPEEKQEVAPAPEVKEGRVFEPYTKLGCEKLLSDEEFTAKCGPAVVVTYKTGTNNCFISMKDYENERLTAGITLTAYESAETAMAEFERRAEVLKIDLNTFVGEKVYEFPKFDRETFNFVRGRFL